MNKNKNESITLLPPIPKPLPIESTQKTLTIETGTDIVVAATNIGLKVFNPESFALGAVRGLLTSHVFYGEGRDALMNGAPSYARKTAIVLAGPHDAVDQKFLNKSQEIQQDLHSSGKFLQNLTEELKSKYEHIYQNDEDNPQAYLLIPKLREDLKKLNEAAARFEKLSQLGDEQRKKLHSACFHLQRFRNLLDSHEFAAGTDLINLAAKIGVSFAPHIACAAATLGISVAVSVGIVLSLIIAEKGLTHYKETVEETTIKIFNAIDVEIKQLNYLGIISLREDFNVSEKTFPGKQKMDEYLKSVQDLLFVSKETKITQKEYDLIFNISNYSIQGYHVALEKAAALITEVKSGRLDQLLRKKHELQQDIDQVKAVLKKVKLNTGMMQLSEIGSKRSDEESWEIHELKEQRNLENLVKNYLMILEFKLISMLKAREVIDSVLSQKYGRHNLQLESAQILKQERPHKILVSLPSSDDSDSRLSPQSPISPVFLSHLDKKNTRPINKIESLKSWYAKKTFPNRQENMEFMVNQFNVIVKQFNCNLNNIMKLFEQKNTRYEDHLKMLDNLRATYQAMNDLAGKIQCTRLRMETPVEEKRQAYAQTASFFQSIRSKEYMHGYHELEKKCENMQKITKVARLILHRLSVYDSHTKPQGNFEELPFIIDSLKTDTATSGQLTSGR